MKKTLLLFLLALATSSAAAQDTVDITVCKYFWKTGEPINGDGFHISESVPGAPIWFDVLHPIDSNENCAQLPVLSDGLPGGVTRCFGAYKNDNYFNGITVLDLIAISKHILGLEPLSPPYGIIAADVNMSGSITAFDMVALRKIVLGTNDTLVAPVWRFFPETCQFPNPSNPFSGSGCPCIPSEEMPMWDNDTLSIIGVKSGDVDGDAVLNGQFLWLPTEDSITMILPDETLAPGVHALPVGFEGSFDLIGTQMEFQVDTSKARFDSIIGAALNLPSGTWSSFSDGRIRVVGLPDISNPVGPNSTLFYLRLTVDEQTALSDLIQIKKASLQPLAVAADQNQPLAIGLQFSGSVATQQLSMGEFVVGPASPNPYTDLTYISVRLAQAEQVHLEITDMTGRKAYTTDAILEAGEHRLEIPSSVLPRGSSGIFRVQAGRHMATGKLMRL